MTKKIIVTILSILLVFAFTSCGGGNAPALEDELAAITKSIEETTLDDVSDSEKESIEKLQKEYIDKINKAESKEDAEKLKKEYEQKVANIAGNKAEVPETEEPKDEEKDSDKSDSKDKTSSSSSSNGTSSSGSSSSSSATSDSKKPASSSSSNTTSKPSSGSNGNSSGSSSSNTESKPSTEAEKERTVTVKYPVYGPMYTYYWIKDDNGKVIYETKDAKEWEHILSTPDNDIYYKASTYGQDSKNDIVGYESYTYTESEYNDRLANSNLGSRTDVIITWN